MSGRPQYRNRKLLNADALAVVRELEALAPGDVLFFHSKRKHEAPTYVKVITKTEYEATFDGDEEVSDG